MKILDSSIANDNESVQVLLFSQVTFRWVRLLRDTFSARTIQHFMHIADANTRCTKAWIPSLHPSDPKNLFGCELWIFIQCFVSWGFVMLSLFRFFFLSLISRPVRCTRRVYRMRQTYNIVHATTYYAILRYIQSRVLTQYKSIYQH